MTTLKPPSHSDEIQVEIPTEHVLLVTFNRPKDLNAMTPTMQEDLRRVLDWFENEPELLVVIVAGAGRMFCAGADLKAFDTKPTNRWSKNPQQNNSDDLIANKDGFASISRRQSVKPIIAAVCGGAHGGGTEIVLNCDIVIADAGAKFSLPEVKRGVLANGGGRYPILASELLLLGRVIDATEAQMRFGFVNRVVSLSDVLPTALAMAQEIVANSPDSVQATKEILLLSQNLGTYESYLAQVKGPAYLRLSSCENLKVNNPLSVTSTSLNIVELKRAPKWKTPAKL
ncbi:hypothetical protein H0H93_005334 [Arthromyces matolae]|nr:hypothetical protein H0H93_005334 [Arthromyces matolae]